MRKRSKNWAFWTLTTVSILFACRCFQLATADRVNPSAIGGEVFTIAFPLWIIERKISTMARANRRLIQKLNQQSEPSSPSPISKK